VREQALNLIRNLAFVHGRAELDLVFADVLDTLLALLASQLVDGTPPDVAVQALYVLCNLATGSAALKDRIMASAALRHVLRLMVRPPPPCPLRCAAASRRRRAMRGRRCGPRPCGRSST
jgi:hypothetical protein